MGYKNDVKPQKGDAVLGVLGGLPARGKVVAYNEKKDVITVQRRGVAVDHVRPNGSKTGHKLQGALERLDAPAADFELIYRKEA